MMGVGTAASTPNTAATPNALPAESFFMSFWMKNVPVPLDMVFIYQGRIQALASQAPPCVANPCPTYGPQGQLVDQVIELAAGRAAELGLRVGDGVAVRPLDEPVPLPGQ